MIAKALGLDRKTVHRYAHAATPEDASLGTGSRRYGQVHAYSPYLYRRWAEGCMDAARLHAEITELGLPRQQAHCPPSPGTQLRAGDKPAHEKPKELTVRKATWLINAHPDKIDESSALKCKQLLSRCPELDAAADCVRDFARMMTERHGNELDDWLTRAENTGLKPLRSLSRGLRQDFNAVAAGLTLEWSSRKVEGSVNG